MNYCNDCPHITPDEIEQSRLRKKHGVFAPHMCDITGIQVHHAGEHPGLPTPDWCPLEDE